MNLETYAYAHILGGLYGQALGDAWAMPALLRPDQTWEHYQGWIGELLPAPPDHPVHAGLQAGQVTDDTQQAIALAQNFFVPAGFGRNTDPRHPGEFAKESRQQAA